MKKVFLLSGFLCVLSVAMLCMGCTVLSVPIAQAPEKTEAPNTEFSYMDLEFTEPVSVIDGLLTVILVEDGPLPYRWNYQLSGDGSLSLVYDDYISHEPLINLPAAGHEDAFHVWQFKADTPGEVELSFELVHLYDESDVWKTCDISLNVSDSGEISVISSSDPE